MRRIHWLVAVIIAAIGCSFAQFQPAVADSDHDGLSDEMEQALLLQFRPTFMISSQDCDLAPAEFLPGITKPTVAHRNGTIYGQAFRSARSTSQTDAIELHFYHLWGSDCGRLGHPLDAEHVSALIERPAMSPASEPWRATYWYAAAHQDTVCDSSSGAHAIALLAQNHGPVVWISAGKHASYFTAQDCKFGCGGDRCRNTKELEVSAVINLGEVDAPMQQSVWITSPQWPLAQKMRPEFDDRTIVTIDDHEKLTARLGNPQAPQSMLIGPNAAFDSLAITNQQTSNALAIAGKQTLNSFKSTFRSVKKALTPKK
jgi:hypothetical protein